MKPKPSQKKRPVVAICYDFDKTLSPKDMQDFSLLPKLNCNAEDFWRQSNEFAKTNATDKILSYMQLILKKAQSADIRLTKDDFKEMGEAIELFDGVTTWFDRINTYAEKLGLTVEHYIISAGLKEILEGTPIAKYFKCIYASSFVYTQYGEPIWPGQVVNYTTKTQYLFRINKDCLDLSDEESINEYIPEDERRIPFSRFIYIGDSDTDIPAMRIVKNGGGVSIGVYNRTNSNLEKVRGLLKNNRIDYFTPADYSENAQLERLVMATLNKISATEALSEVSKQQNEYSYEIERSLQFYDYTKELLDTSELDSDTLSFVEEQSNYFMQTTKDNLLKYSGMVPQDVISRFIKDLTKQTSKLFKAARKKLNDPQNEEESTKLLQPADPKHDK